jgi:hypothetical protein
MLRSQRLSINPYPELNHSKFHIYTYLLNILFFHLALSKDLLSLRLLDNIFKALLTSAILSTCPTHFIVVYLMTLTTLTWP